MTAVRVERRRALPPPTAGKELGWWGMVMFIATEAVLFASLLFSYGYLWANASQWPPGDIPTPELLRSGIRSLLLVGSSIPIHLAEKAYSRGRRAWFSAGVVVALVMSGIFMAGHVREMIHLWEHEFTFRTNQYGSIFHTIVNFHAFHLITGQLMLVFMLVQGLRGAWPDTDLPVTNTTMYWHFVDVVWVAVYSTLYIAPNLT